MRRRSMLGALMGAAMLGWNGTARAQSVTADVKASLAPTGTLRAAINYGNAVLASRNAAGELSGVSVDIAHELARRLGLPLSLVPFREAGEVSAAASKNVWDVAFLARDPARAQSITFTAAYVVIDGNYVVLRTSPIVAVDQIDRDGVTIAVAVGSAYDLFLTRTLKHAHLVRAASGPEALALLRSNRTDVLAGVKEALAQIVASDPSLRMIAEPFMTIDQAVGTPAARPAAASAYLSAFVEEIKASGFVAQALKRNGQDEALVAPPR
jgi:polar amino acid transport system substrate-binding protein